MQHLTQQQRCHLEELMSSGFSCREIGKQLGIHASTVSREWRRNKVHGRYNYIVAQSVSEARRHEASARFKKIKNELEEKILAGLYNFGVRSKSKEDSNWRAFRSVLKQFTSMFEKTA